MAGTIELRIEHGDIGSFPADVAAFKYAQGFHGADASVAKRLIQAGVSESTLRPQIGEHVFVETRKAIAAQYALFVGVSDLWKFDYASIRLFGGQVLNVLSGSARNARHLVMTIHGPGYGLDEVEALLAQVGGYLDALQNGQVPASLQLISIVDRDQQRVDRLRSALDLHLTGAGLAGRQGMHTGYHLSVPARASSPQQEIDQISSVGSAGESNVAKSHAFVAIPYKVEMDDVFYYGIQRPVHLIGFLCERVDKSAFTGDIIDRIKRKIETAAVVVAELTEANPNVCLEVGYAWGKGRPTVLVVRKNQEVPFDLRGQKYLEYETIRGLEDMLTHELQQLQRARII